MIFRTTYHVQHDVNVVKISSSRKILSETFVQFIINILKRFRTLRKLLEKNLSLYLVIICNNFRESEFLL
jgi:hypothetical protein